MPDPTTATRFRPSPGGAGAPGDAPGLGGAADGALLPFFFALENIPIGNDYPRGAARGAKTRGGCLEARVGAGESARARGRARTGRGEAEARRA